MLCCPCRTWCRDLGQSASSPGGSWRRRVGCGCLQAAYSLLRGALPSFSSAWGAWSSHEHTLCFGCLQEMALKRAAFARKQQAIKAALVSGLLPCPICLVSGWRRALQRAAISFSGGFCSCLLGWQ